MTEEREPLTYAAAGVDISLAKQSLDQMMPFLARTHNPYMLDRHGQPFASPVDIGQAIEDLKITRPVIAPTIDSAGTIPQEAIRVIDWFPNGMVNTAYNVAAHCCADVACGGIRPFLFLDMISSTDMRPDVNTLIARGVSEACLELQVGSFTVAIPGGELAQIRGTLAEGQWDIIGVGIGLGDQNHRIIPEDRVKPGMPIIGYMVGFHQINGSSLLRKVLEIAGLGLRDTFPPTGQTVAESILKRQPNWAKMVMAQLDAGIWIAANSHITGGGLPDNISRNLPEGCRAHIWRENWTRPEFFSWIQETGNVPDQDFWGSLNNGVGYAQILPDMAVASDAMTLASQLGFEGRVIGKIVEGERGVVII